MSWSIVINCVLALGTLVIAVFAVVQALAAKRSADNDDKTARLTQRADVLLESIEMIKAEPKIGSDTQVVLRFKNFGPTRASGLIFDFQLKIPGVLNASIPPATVVLGSGDNKPVIFQRLGEMVKPRVIEEVANGKTPLSFAGTITFSDVFGKSHTIECHGDYNHQTRSFNARESPSD